MTQPIVVLDFDGVICDSTEECIVTAWNAWQAHSGKKERVRTTDEVPEPFRDAIRKHRSYVRTAGEYLLLIESARMQRNIASEKDYERLFHEFCSAIKPFASAFFAAREQLRKNQEHWLSLHEVYPGIPESLRRLRKHFDLFVVTGKDRTSVQIFFETFSLPLESSRIYDKDVAHDKLAAIRSIVGEEGRALASTFFVDDNIHHLLPADEAGCVALMAGWGYHTPAQMEMAERRSIPILELETWAEMLLQWKVPA